MSNVKKTLVTVLVGGVGGGIAAMTAAAADPSKYSFPKDLGSGKLWPFFFQGAAIGIGALFVKSPFGRKIMALQEKQREDTQTVAEARSKLKAKEKQQ
jgi:hypothetical protein